MKKAEIYNYVFENYIKNMYNSPSDAEYCPSEAKELVDDIIKKLGFTEENLGNLLYLFWQSSSDACPLEIREAEKQEDSFKEWIKTTYFQELKDKEGCKHLSKTFNNDLGCDICDDCNIKV